MGSEGKEPPGLNLAEVVYVFIFSATLAFRFISLPLFFAAVIVARTCGSWFRSGGRPALQPSS